MPAKFDLKIKFIHFISIKMAQVAQAGTDRNTNNIRSGKREKSRNWAFTLNNYMEADIKNICNDEYQYIFQEETGESGTPHLQGTIILKQPQALSYLKKINGRAHWEICRNKFASINYCQKGLTRTGMLYTNMDVPDLMAQKNGTSAIPKHAELCRELDIENRIRQINWDFDIEDPTSELYQLLFKS